jgi:type III secretory pathway component EscV
LGVLGPLLCLLYEKYLPLQLKIYPLDKIITCLLSAVLNSIFVGGRSGRTPNLATNYSSQAGYQFVNFIVSGLFALAFGLLAGFLLKMINSLNE